MLRSSNARSAIRKQPRPSARMRTFGPPPRTVRGRQRSRSCPRRSASLPRHSPTLPGRVSKRDLELHLHFAERRELPRFVTAQIGARLRERIQSSSSYPTRSGRTSRRAGANVGAPAIQGVSRPKPTYSSWRWSSANALAGMSLVVSAVGSVSPPPVAIESSPASAACVRARSIISMTGHVTSRRQNHHM